MVKVEHRPEAGQLRIVLREDLEEGPGGRAWRDRALWQGQRRHSRRSRREHDQVRYDELEPGHGRYLSKEILERYDEGRCVVHRSPAEVLRRFWEAIEYLEAAEFVARRPDIPSEGLQTTVKESSTTQVFVSTRHTG